MSVRKKKSFNGKLKLTYSELFFSAEKLAGNYKIFTAAQLAGICTSNANNIIIIKIVMLFIPIYIRNQFVQR